MPLKAGVRNRDEVMDEIVTMVRAELSALSDAGADYIQLDEPALPSAARALALRPSLVNRTAEGSMESAPSTCVSETMPDGHSQIVDLVD